jgi:HSP20 family protein
MAIVRWDPFAELNTLHEQVNSLFNDTFGDVSETTRVTPVTDIYADEKGLHIEIHMPNFGEDEISVDEHEGVLDVRAEHKERGEENKNRSYLVRESVTQYYRRFALPNNADAEHIDAKFEDGILHITIPYKEQPKPNRIALKPTKSKDK